MVRKAIVYISKGLSNPLSLYYIYYELRSQSVDENETENKRNIGAKYASSVPHYTFLTITDYLQRIIDDFPWRIDEHQ